MLYMDMQNSISVLPHVPLQVQCLQWHPYEPELLVTGGYDKCVTLV